MPRFSHYTRRFVVSSVALAVLWTITTVPPVHAGGLAASNIHRRAGEAADVVALLIGDTNDSRIGRAVVKDLERLGQALRLALGDRVRMKVLQGNQATAG